MHAEALRSIDVVYHYAGHHGAPSRCRLRLFRPGLDRPTVAIVSELTDNPGTSITNRAEEIADEVIRGHGLDAETHLHVEHYPRRGHVPERFRFVSFTHDQASGRLSSPVWSDATRAAVGHLIGQRLAD